jgi:hypothetical protein
MFSIGFGEDAAVVGKMAGQGDWSSIYGFL